jgi:hypothetical protein
MLIQRVVLQFLIVAMMFVAGFATALLGIMTTKPGVGGNFAEHPVISVTEVCRYVEWHDPIQGGTVHSTFGCTMEDCERAVFRTIRLGDFTWTRSFETLPGWRGCVPAPVPEP